MNNLRIVDIKKSIKKTEILHGISLEINSGEILSANLGETAYFTPKLPT